MARPRITQRSRFRIDQSVRRRDEMTLELAAQCLVETGVDAAGIASISCLRRECNLQHRRDQRGGHTMPGYIRDKNANALFVDDKEIVEIARNLGHWNVARSDVQRTDPRNVTRKDRHLDLAGGLEFVSEVV